MPCIKRDDYIAINNGLNRKLEEKEREISELNDLVEKDTQTIKRLANAVDVLEAKLINAESSHEKECIQMHHMLDHVMADEPSFFDLPARFAAYQHSLILAKLK